MWDFFVVGMVAFFHGRVPARNFGARRSYCGGFLSWSDFQRIWRKIPRVSSASEAERRRRRTRRRIFSSVGAAERRFWEPLSLDFEEPLERRPASNSVERRARSAPVEGRRVFKIRSGYGLTPATRSSPAP